MRWSVLYLALFELAACNNTSKSPSESNSNSSRAHSLEQVCFQRLEGLQNQDTTFLRLLISGDEVTGAFDYLPYQKDSRKGNIRGEKDGEIIRAVWTYMQEGIEDTLKLEFKLQESSLLQKRFAIDPITGREILTDTSTFSIPYESVECSGTIR